MIFQKGLRARLLCLMFVACTPDRPFPKSSFYSKFLGYKPTNSTNSSSKILRFELRFQEFCNLLVPVLRLGVLLNGCLGFLDLCLQLGLFVHGHHAVLLLLSVGHLRATAEAQDQTNEGGHEDSSQRRAATGLLVG